MRKLIALILLIVPCALWGCAVESKVGDPLSTCIDNEGGRRRMSIRDEGEEIWVEWSYGASVPFARVVFLRADWVGFDGPVSVGAGESISISEPRAIRVEYDYHGIRGF